MNDSNPNPETTAFDCEACSATGHSENGMWDCFACEGTGIQDTPVREACITLVACARQIPKDRVSPETVHSFWQRVNELHRQASTP